MILKIKNPKSFNQKIIKNMENLKGFVNRKTIEKYIKRNQKLTEKLIEKKNKIYKFNPNKILFALVFFCGSLFIYHMYTLWIKYKEESSSDNFDNSLERQQKLSINIVPLAGIY